VILRLFLGYRGLSGLLPSSPWWCDQSWVHCYSKIGYNEDDLISIAVYAIVAVVSWYVYGQCSQNGSEARIGQKGCITFCVDCLTKSSCLLVDFQIESWLINNSLFLIIKLPIHSSTSSGGSGDGAAADATVPAHSTLHGRCVGRHLANRIMTCAFPGPTATRCSSCLNIAYWYTTGRYRPQLNSASSSSLIVGRTRLSTVGDRTFPVAAARIWNSLPQHVTSAPSLLVFRSRLKTHLFAISYPSPWQCTVLAQWHLSFCTL